MSDIRFVVTIDDKFSPVIQKLTTELGGVVGAADKTKTAGAGLEQEFGRVWQQFAAGAIAANALQKTIGGVAGFFKSAFEGAVAEEASQRRLTAALELTGRARGGTAQRMLDFAQSQAKVTNYTHEEIEASETLLAQLTDLDEKGILQMMRGVLGLSAVLGPEEGGLRGATMMVTKAMEGNMTALRRSGIIIDDTLPKEEQMIELKRRLIELYPRATAEVDMMAGKVKSLGKAWGEFKEGIGGVFGPTVVGTMGFFTRALKDQEEAIKWHGQASKDATAKAVEFRETLKFAVPDMKELTAAALKGGPAWDAYTAHLTLLDFEMKAWEPTVKKAYDALVKFMGVTEPKPVLDLASAMKDLGLKTGEQLSKELSLAQRSLDAVLASTKPAPGVVEALAKKISELQAQLKGANFELDRFGHLVPKGSLNIPERFQNIEPPTPTVAEGKDMWAGVSGIGAAAKSEFGDVADVMKDAQDELDKVCSGFYRMKAAQASSGKATDEWAQIWNTAIGTALAGAVTFGDATGSIFKNIGKIFGNFVKELVAGLELMVLKEMWAAQKTVAAEKMKAVAKYIGTIFAKLPFPLNLIVAAGAFAVINALFAKILKFQEGGVFTKPTLAEVGHGTEYLLPERKLIRIVQEAMLAPAAVGVGQVGGAQFTQHFHAPIIQTRGLSQADIDEAAERTWLAMEKAARRRGFNLARGRQ